MHSETDFINVIEAWAQFCYERSAAKGFWDQRPRNKGEMIALMHSELSEMLEAVRSSEKSLLMSEKIPEFTAEEEEAADLLIRLLDYCGGHKLKLAEAVCAKMGYNANRPHRHGRAF